MRIVIWRDSVAMGDDIDAPHERIVDVPDDASIGTIVADLANGAYLASIAGGRATWIVDGTRPLAVVAQQWDVPRWLVAPDAPAAPLRRPDGSPDFHVRYWLQVDPERVFAALERGTPLPDRYDRR